MERIVEVSAFVAVPLAGRTLAGLGHEVVRVDPPVGGLDFGRWPVTADGESIFWRGLNRGKRSALIDYRTDEGCELLAAMIAASGDEGGVFLTNLGARGRLSYQSLSQRRADVIAVEVEGYPDGRSAVDYTVAAGTGIPLITGPRGHDGPVNSPIPTWDIATGLTAAIAMTDALGRRRSSHQGAHVRIALADVALDVLSALGFVDEANLAIEPRSRDGNYLYGAFGRDFALSDGSRVMIVALTKKQWRALVAALGMGADVAALERSTGLDLDHQGDRYRARHEIASIVEDWCASRDLRTASEAFDTYQVCWGAYGSASTFAEDVRRHRGELPATGEDLVRLPFRVDGSTSTSLSSPPTFGQHTDEVLAELLGLSDREIGQLHDKNVVAGPARSGDLSSALGSPGQRN